MTSDEAFTELTGLHRCFDKTPSWHQHVIWRQAQTIRDLRAQRAQLTKGFQRKIAKLERQLSAARASIPPNKAGETE